MLNVHNVQCDFYTLKYVKVDQQVIENNPILLKSKQYLDLAASGLASGIDALQLEESQLQEMKDTVHIDQQSPNERQSAFVFGWRI